MTTLAKLRASERWNLAPEGLPVHGVGHSNGALLHLLIGSLFSPQNASNVIISFNNKCGLAPYLPAVRLQLHTTSSAERKDGGHCKIVHSVVAKFCLYVNF